MTQEELPTRRIARHVRELRSARGWSAERLAAALGEYGVHWDRSIVANLENGRRQTVSVEEWLAIALVLDVAPLRLVLPPEAADDVQLTATRSAGWQAAWRWAVGEQPLDELPLSDPKVDAWIRDNRPFERDALQEAARFLEARLPDVPWTAELQRSADGRVKRRLSIDDVDEQE